jgi:asparagine N-glycosylation enzyme membrane subunit Stt3
VLLEGAEGCQVAPSLTIILAYSSVHLVALTLFGFLGSWLMHGSEQQPSLWFGALMVFIVAAWHLTAAVLGVLGPVQGCISLWPPTLAGFAGALAMAAYLWISHPAIHRALRGERYA